MLVKELKEYLETLNEDAKVYIYLMANENIRDLSLDDIWKVPSGDIEIFV